MSEDKYRIDPNITNKIMDSKAINYGHAIGKMFDDLGGIVTKEAENAQKQGDRELTQKSLKLGIDNAEKDQIIKGISLQNLKDEAADATSYLAVATSDKPDEAIKNVKFLTPKFQALGKSFVDTNKSFLTAEETKKHFDTATSMFSNEDGTFDRKGAINHLKTKFTDGKITAETVGSVIDAIDKAGKNGIYREYVDPSTTLKLNAELNKTNAMANYYKRKGNESGSSSSEYERNLKTLFNAGRITQDEYYEKMNERVDKMANPDMTAISKDLSVSEKYKNKFIIDLKKQDDFKDIDMDSIVNIDMTKLTPEQKSKAESLANIIIRAEKPSASGEITKRMLDIGVQQKQLNDTTKLTLKYMKEGKDFNMVDKIVRENLSNYIGLNEKELEGAWRDARFQESLNIQLKIQSGTAVSAQEWDRFKSSMGTLYQTNKRVALGMLSMATNMKSQVEILSNSMGSDAFHLKYGHITGNISKMENDLQEALFGEKETQKKVTRIVGEPQAPTQQQQEQTMQQPKTSKVVDINQLDLLLYGDKK